ncbi:MAG: prepilin peptidase [Rubrivivax sp.]|nr:prepilin peptidase [Rubrivivax sp.]
MVGLIGLVVGSFLNVVVHRLPQMLERGWWGDVAGQLGDVDSHRRVFGREPAPSLTGAATALETSLVALPAMTLSRPASRCPHCGHRIRWYENIPILSWLVLRGRCSSCGAGIGWRYPFVELLTGALFASVAWRWGADPWAVGLWCAAVALLVAMSAIDWDTTVLPDNLTLPMLWLGILAAAGGWLPGVSLLASVAGAAAGYLALWSVYWVFKLATGKEGMGYGDFKLLAALGAWLGWQAVLPIVLTASAMGAVVGLAMKATGALREGRYVPFGPFLAGGGVGVMLIGLPQVLGWMGW